ncbi:glyoxal oxidase N-terminus-domain-containing protein [Lentinula aciculospora]|uniref:Glyoxal oxidase N-terminus-domain-containing protein n=1 Tax=Lentinula aciculospora TaxID=153920 RepID=A0A9W9A593_9AGAR|nr:glyoxal oxidase N-terminus-domain-containing protein [Lentinula aciculospora]
MRFPTLLFSLSLAILSLFASTELKGDWTFVRNGTTGITASQVILVSPTLILMLDRVLGDPLQINGHQAWAELWNLETNTGFAVNAITNTFCASGAFISNGTMVSVGGQAVEFPPNVTVPPDADGRMGIRIFEPCDDPSGLSCTLFEDPATLHLAVYRWYPSSLRIFDGSLMIIGGTHEQTPFYNTDPENTFEFFPAKDDSRTRFSPFLARTVPTNLFPRAFALPDGKIFMVAYNQSIVYDIEAQTETILPSLPNGIHATNPKDGTATLLPLFPPEYIPEILVCGGSNTSDSTPSEKLSSQDPASDQCTRIMLTPEGIAKGWVAEKMPEGRMMPEMVLMPNGQVLIINGAGTGYAAYDSVNDTIGNSNADHPVLNMYQNFTPVLYNPDAPLGSRFSKEGLPTTDIARLYHSGLTLTPSGNIFIAGSNPNPGVIENATFNTFIIASEFQVEFLNPPFMSLDRPSLSEIPGQVEFNQKFAFSINIPEILNTNDIKVALMDMGYSSHAFHSSSRLVFMNAELSEDEKSLTVTTPPNNRVYPPGPAYIFVTVDDVTSTGTRVMVGNGAAPPVKDQGISVSRQV